MPIPLVSRCRYYPAYERRRISGRRFSLDPKSNVGEPEPLRRY